MPGRLAGLEGRTEVMEWPRKILIASIGVNVVLGVAWTVLAPGKNVAPPEEVAVKRDVAARKAKAAARKLEMPAEIVDNTDKFKFDWAQVESEDFKKYIANLRTIGCPELTIQDIILAELDYIFEPKLNALKGLNAPWPERKFWREGDVAPARKRAENADQEIKRLEDERRALVKELLGKEEKPLRTANNYFQDEAQSRHAFLNPDQLERMHQLESKYEKLGGAMAKDTGYKNEEARQQMLAEMRTFMSKEEIFEYEIRTSNLAKQLRNSLKSAEPTEQEFREIFAANYEAYALNASGKAEAQELQAAKQKAQESVRNALGEERVTEMERNRDYGYRQLMAAGNFLGYDRAAALRVYEMQGDTQKALQVIYTNTELSPEQRNKAIMDIRTAAEKTIEKELGASGAKHYLKYGGSWIRRLGPQSNPIPGR
jgi:hypothetical protein